MRSTKLRNMGKLCLFVALILSASFYTVALPPTAQGTNYVVVGAFAQPSNAVHFTEKVKNHHLTAEYAINPLRNLFYVYVLHTDDKGAAIDQAKKLREEPLFADAWVFTGVLGEQANPVKGSDINPTTGKTQEVKQADPEKVAEPVVTPPVVEEKKEEVKPTETVAATPPPIVEDVEGAKKFLFKITTGGKEMAGDVDLMDLDKSKPRKFATYRGNEVVNVKPINKSGNVSFDCEVFGYRKIKEVVNYNTPEQKEGVTAENNIYTIPFELVRLKKGDIAVMYNVFFYKDAGVMLPESRYEANSLMEMMKENPKYRIRIHGHTNGNAAGKVIYLNEGNTNFFSLNNTTEGYGSAKKLSEERATVLMNYLISQGIDASRIEVKAWGGKKPIYEQDHTMARANVRVEIEILEN